MAGVFSLQVAFLTSVVPCICAINPDEPHSFVFAYFSSPWRRPHVSYTVISAAASVGNVTFKSPVQSILNPFSLTENSLDKPFYIHEHFRWDENDTTLFPPSKAFLVQANGHVNVQTGLHVHRTGDVMSMLPLTTASTEFYVPSFPTYNDTMYNLRSAFLVVSMYNDTCVEATYLNDTGPYLIESQCLGELEVLEKLATHGDFTGVHINSTRPFAVIGGHECAYIPLGTTYCDLIMDAAPPLAEWGKEFIVGPLLGRKYADVGYGIRVVAGYDHTEMEVVGGGSELAYIRNRGRYIHINVANTEHIMTVTCSKACMVIQYNRGKLNDDYETDPFMMVITPINHFTNNMTFSTPLDVDEEGNLQTMRNFLTVVAPDHSRSGVLLNTQSISTMTDRGWTGKKLGNYSVISVPIRSGDYNLHHPDPQVKLVGYVHGHATAEHGRTGYGFATGYKVFSEGISGQTAPILSDTTTPRASKADKEETTVPDSSTALTSTTSTLGTNITTLGTYVSNPAFAGTVAPIVDASITLDSWVIILLAVLCVLVFVALVLGIVCHVRHRAAATITNVSSPEPKGNDTDSGETPRRDEPAQLLLLEILGATRRDAS